ncbi:MAG: matrixin family metalloprotease [Oligoflexus sp.]
MQRVSSENNVSKAWSSGLDYPRPRAHDRLASVLLKKWQDWLLLLLSLFLLLMLRLLMLLRFALTACFAWLLNACGENRVVSVKDFRVYVATEDAEMKGTVDVLVDRFNHEFGREVLKVVEDQALSNSIIRFQAGLREDGRKLGLGQWITTTTQQSAMTIEGNQITTRVEYGMELAFDETNFRSKAPYIADADSPEAQHLYHLFCHEVGHGMQLDHTDERQNVMFPSIPDRPNREIDFDKFFVQVRRFMGTVETAQVPASLPRIHNHRHRFHD